MCLESSKEMSVAGAQGTGWQVSGNEVRKEGAGVLAWEGGFLQSLCKNLGFTESSAALDGVCFLSTAYPLLPYPALTAAAGDLQTPLPRNLTCWLPVNSANRWYWQSWKVVGRKHLPSLSEGDPDSCSHEQLACGNASSGSLLPAVVTSAALPIGSVERSSSLAVVVDCCSY